MSNSSRKRSPFGEAPADIGIRSSTNNYTSDETETMASMTMARSGVVNIATAPPPPPPPYPPPSPAQKQKRRMQQQNGSISSILGTGMNAPSALSPRQRQQIDPPPLQLKNTTNNDDDDNASRARLYKAEAYEAKIRIASQEQRIQELQAEIEEMRLFQKEECESKDNTHAITEGQEKIICKDDAELIEALAEELETMEKDMNAAQARVAELEQELRELRLKSEDYEASMMESASPSYLKEVELKKQLELQQQELINAKNDAREGIAIVKDLHGALRLARAERDEARSNLSTLRSEMEQYQKIGDATEQSAVVRELEAALKSTRNERDEALLELSSLFEEVNSLRECSTVCEKLEQSNKSLQTELEKLQNQSGSDLHEAIVEAREREAKMKQEYNKLLEESKQMESALEEIVHKFEEQRNELAMKTAAIEELQDLHVTNIADLNKEHANEMETMRLCHEDAIQSLETRHAQELQKQNELLQSRESDWGAQMSLLQDELINSETIVNEYEDIETSDRIEIEKLKNELKEMKTIANNMDLDRPHDELVAGLKLENAELHRQLEDHKQMVSELEASKSVLDDKKMLQKDEQVMQTETSSTQDESEAEATTSSSMRDESSIHSGQLSRIEQLERELARSKKANASLEDALRDMQVALVAVSSRKSSPSKKEIEDDALREYCAQRFLGNHST